MLKRIFTYGFLFIISTQVAQTVERPKLVVGIVVDQMRYDYIYRFWDKYGNSGFKRLLNEGFFCQNTNYNYVPTYTAPGHAAIYTGTTPAVNGIIANDWFSREQGKNIYCVTDNQVESVGSTAEEGKRSPNNLLTTTITDELRMATNMRSKVISISLKDRSAILPGGHMPNASYWYDGSNGSFISSTYYMKELPKWLQEFNARKLAQKYVSEDWKTLLPIDQYTESGPDDYAVEEKFTGEQKPVFPHAISSLMAANGGLSIIRRTPFGNALLKDFAIETITSENLGKSDATDFIAISFSSTDYVGHSYGPNSVELEDTYLRLDTEVAELLNFVDAQVGKKNALVFLTADHGVMGIPKYLQESNIPAGYVDEKKLTDTIQQFLIKTYNLPLLSKYFNQQVYLDRKTIEAKKLKLEEVQRGVADFLQTLPYTMETLTATELMLNSYTEGTKAFMQKGFNAKRSGDVLINFLPGYAGYHATGTSHGSPFSYDTHVPLIFYGWNISAGSTVAPVAITDISPTLAMLLHIQFPSGCTGQPIQAVFNK
ncbi:MAG TPA: alkaline phosphatase PafA [Bacteroidia bacterium]|jgi:predicted AlkP superfamily pyrophosphatase or phosphodiesterase|nr:alkaline phosphatase PafA [Bacteroidia bacterium]